MTAFRSRWDDWEPKEPTLRTDKADKSPSVSFGSTPPRRLSEAEGASVSSVSTSPKPFTSEDSPSNPETGSQETPTPCTDRTDKSSPQAFNLTTDKADERSQPARVVLLAVPPGVPETWTQGVADLLAMACPASCPEARWNVLREDSYSFLRDWAARAHALNWTAHDLFGAHPESPLERFDCAGLILVLNGAAVVALSDSEATITRPNGALVTFRKRGQVPDEACPVWCLK